MTEKQKLHSYISELVKIMGSTQYDLILRKISAILELIMKTDEETQVALINFFIKNFGNENLEKTKFFINAPLVNEVTYKRLSLSLGEEIKVMFSELVRTGNSSQVVAILLVKRLKMYKTHDERVVVLATLVENDLLPYNYINYGLELSEVLQLEIVYAYSEEFDAIVNAALAEKLKFRSGLNQGCYILNAINGLEYKGFDMTLVRSLAMYWAMDCLTLKSSYRKREYRDASTLNQYDYLKLILIKNFELDIQDEQDGQKRFIAQC